jgi:hypothetical protein
MKPDECLLLQAVGTPLGIFAAGVRVIVLRIAGAHLVLCMDAGGNHPSGRCHTATVPPYYVSRTKQWRRKIREAA